MYYSVYEDTNWSISLIEIGTLKMSVLNKSHRNKSCLTVHQSPHREGQNAFTTVLFYFRIDQFFMNII